jgi:hypothetical protein
VTLTAPPGFVPDETNKPPDLSQAPQVELTQWDAWRSGDDALVAACFAAKVDSWTPEADPLARAKLDETIAGAALRAPPAPQEMPITVRKAQGFVPGSILVSCFAWCRGARCADAVNAAKLPDAFVAPPAPSLGLRVVLALVHHPAAAAGALVGLAVLGGGLAIAARPRPKRKKRRG